MKFKSISAGGISGPGAEAGIIRKGEQVRGQK
jgi:hypothetical protein